MILLYSIQLDLQHSFLVLGKRSAALLQPRAGPQGERSE